MARRHVIVRRSEHHEAAGVLDPAAIVATYNDSIWSEAVRRRVLAAADRRARAGAREVRRKPRAALRPSPHVVAAIPSTTPTDRPGDARATKEHTMKTAWNGSLAAYAVAVRNAITKKGPVDSRLGIFAAAPGSTISTEGIGSDGGYLVPPDVRRAVVDVVLGETSLLALTDRNPTKSNSVLLPADAAPSWYTTGPQPAMDPEAAALKQSKFALEGRTVRLEKVDILVPVSDELVEDGGAALDAYLKQAVIDRLAFRVNDLLINGAGTSGQPQGILNSPALVVQTKESGQAAGTVAYGNVSKMWSRLYAPARTRAVWLCHSDVEQQLQNATTPQGTPVIVYWPEDNGVGRIFGRPVLVTEAAQPLGSQGDLMLVDPMGIYTATREGEDDGLREDFSMHVWFDYQVSAFRFTMRLGAQSWWAQPVTRYRGGSTVSTHLTLEPR
ncbi:phage major capsid protein [Anaeromyxobacter oryzae]|uniref:Phage capsid-like C-terminal domain-containing protein n=1 Tax=Anaeromyxobacter oryzae TaxID=2918170 RepID=A0ABM7WZW8_9BACT|nr:phage major capsid protein [Anaeromyxobacter oryzae]BDG04994.1 hypothetical protein AMOR_39900 [Anaeromyxobacter oryzae]